MKTVLLSASAVLVLSFGIWDYIRQGNDGLIEQVSGDKSVSIDGEGADRAAVPALNESFERTPILSSAIAGRQPAPDHPATDDPVMESILKRVDELQNDLASARAQMARTAGETVATVDALRASQALATDRGRQIDALQRQGAALAAELAETRRGATRAGNAAASLGPAREGDDELWSDRTPPRARVAAGEPATADALRTADIQTRGHESTDRPEPPASVPAHVTVVYALGSDMARARAVALQSILAKAGLEAADPVGVPATAPGVHVTYFYRQDQPAAKDISSRSLAPEPTRAQRTRRRTPRPGAIELSVGT